MDNDALLAPPLMEEVKAVALSLPKDRAAGPDGFSAAFYATFWDIGGDDILKAAMDLMAGNDLPRAFNSNLICLIPKSHQRWVQLIKSCWGNNWFSILINGESTGFFKSYRGLRQGDPLSPALFLIAMETFSVNLNLMIASGGCQPFAMRQGYPISSHLLYADDILLFTNGKRESLLQLNQFLALFQAVPEAKDDISYLGAPLCSGRIRSSMFQFLVDKVDRKTSRWASRMISQASRVTLLCHILGSLPIHIMSAMHIPRQVIDKIERSFSNFFWGWADGNRKHHWLAWKKIARTIKERGMGIRRLKEVMDAIVLS
ncbi:uncharacterized protein LOC131217295 [Magnolia sinica]|uniref:uncharacterized protein LOC131217295 n=1 Tax=Magnolia sinica TaxID=86752 RepID=UPI00265A2DA7|nr:uncharacterized protein LOC131217295 [Magnolia sinica]